MEDSIWIILSGKAGANVGRDHIAPRAPSGHFRIVPVPSRTLVLFTPTLPPHLRDHQTRRGNSEPMDGQQRTISLCQYVAGDFAIEIDGTPYFFGNLTAVRQQEILDYELQVYVCEGTDQEKLDWFKIINIAGKKLTPQELRNAIYTGPWLADNRGWFRKTSYPA